MAIPIYPYLNGLKQAVKTDTPLEVASKIIKIPL
jgi:hypothetical protein